MKLNIVQFLNPDTEKIEKGVLIYKFKHDGFCRIKPLAEIENDAFVNHPKNFNNAWLFLPSSLVEKTDEKFDTCKLNQLSEVSFIEWLNFTLYDKYDDISFDL